jgi:hypothetical protein
MLATERPLVGWWRPDALKQIFFLLHKAKNTQTSKQCCITAVFDLLQLSMSMVQFFMEVPFE